MRKVLLFAALIMIVISMLVGQTTASDGGHDRSSTLVLPIFESCADLLVDKIFADKESATLSHTDGRRASHDLNMLYPNGQGLVVPKVGHHEIQQGDTIRLSAIPPATWYAFDLVSDQSMVINPAYPEHFHYLAPNAAPRHVTGGTWVDGTWYVSEFPDTGTNTCSLWSVDPTDGTMTEVGTMNALIFDLAYDEVNDIMYGTAGNALYAVDRSTGVLTYIGPWDTSYLMVDIAYGGAVLYGLCYNTKSLYIINTTTAEATLVGPIGYSVQIQTHGMDYDKDNGRLFLSLIDGSEFYLAEIDLSSGQAFPFASTKIDFTSFYYFTSLAIPYGISHPWVFDHWKLDGITYSTDPVTTLVMNADHTAQAFFTTTEDTQTLRMRIPSGSGSVLPPAGNHVYVKNTIAYLSATPGPGYFFSHWEVNDIYFSSDPEEALFMSDNYNVRAFFITNDFCSPSSIFSQPVDAENIVCKSDVHWGTIGADDFYGLTEPIVGFDFWGLEMENNSAPCDKPLEYIIRFYADGPGPGSQVYEETVSVTKSQSSKIAMGFPSAVVYKYTGMLAEPQYMEKGWFSVQGVDTGNCEFYWADAGKVAGSSEKPFHVFYEGVWYPDMSVEPKHNLAFCLLGEYQPPIPTMGPVGIGILLLALGSLMSFARRRK